MVSVKLVGVQFSIAAREAMTFIGDRETTETIGNLVPKCHIDGTRAAKVAKRKKHANSPVMRLKINKKKRALRHSPVKSLKMQDPNNKSRYVNERKVVRH